jgi:hypothetical protein
MTEKLGRSGRYEGRRVPVERELVSELIVSSHSLDDRDLRSPDLGGRQRITEFFELFPVGTPERVSHSADHSSLG